MDFLNKKKSHNENEKNGRTEAENNRCVQIKSECENKNVLQILGDGFRNLFAESKLASQNLCLSHKEPTGDDLFSHNFEVIKDEEYELPPEKESLILVENDSKSIKANDTKMFEVRRSRRLSICVESFTAETAKKRKEKKSINASAADIKKTKKSDITEEMELPSRKVVESTQDEILVANCKKEPLNEESESSHSSTEKNASGCNSGVKIMKKPERIKRKRKTRSIKCQKKKNKRGINNLRSLTDASVIDEVIEDIWHVSLIKVKSQYVVRFLVKWEGFPPSENTYEPYEHVSHAEVLKDYVHRKLEIHQKKFDAQTRKLMQEAKTRKKGLKTSKKISVLKKLRKFDELKFKCNVLAVLYTYENVPRKTPFFDDLLYQSILYKFYKYFHKETETNRLLAIKFMKEEKNLIKITIENNFTYETLPAFEYLRKVSHPDRVESTVGCSCIGRCSKNNKCCPKKQGVEFVYDVDGRIFASSHQMIVECNKFCSCDQDCPNRRKKPEISFCVFKTPDRGWALKTLEVIPPGKFVIQYTGELIDQNEAERRLKIYDNRFNYMFDLDYNRSSIATYSIDATSKGNLSRFINHSCNANLQTWPATSCNENPDMHRLYYFSLRTIKAGEELTVDYSGGVYNPEAKPSLCPTACKCGENNCKGYIF